MTEACSELGAPLRERSRSEAKSWKQRSPECHLLRRQDDALLGSQSNLDHVTWLKLEILLCGKVFAAVLSLSNNSNLRFAAASTYEL
jgi:hypothetical protein